MRLAVLELIERLYILIRHVDSFMRGKMRAVEMADYSEVATRISLAVAIHPVRCD